MSDYRTLVAALADLDAERTAAVSAATAAYQHAAQAVAEEVALAEESLRAADRAVYAATSHVADVDERASGVWRELGALLGRRGARLGPLPEPAFDGGAGFSGVSAEFGGVGAGLGGVGVGESGGVALDRARELITRAALGEPIALIPRWIMPILPLLGAIASIMVTVPLRQLMWVDGHSTAVHVIAGIGLLFAPFASVPILIAWARRHYGTHPDIGTIGITALGGMIAAAAVALVH